MLFSRKAIAKVICSGVLIFSLLFSFVFPVGAVDAYVKKGHLEYTTDDAINFYGIIEVKLTDKDYGYYYTHSLYKANDYKANLEIPFGRYSVEAKVVSDTQDTTQYSVIVSKEDIIVNNAKLAVPITLRVDVFETFGLAENEVATEDVAAVENGKDNIEIVSDDNSTAPEEYDEKANENIDEKQDKEAKNSSSLLVSTLIFLGIILIMFVAFLLYKRRHNVRR